MEFVKLIYLSKFMFKLYLLRSNYLINNLIAVKIFYLACLSILISIIKFGELFFEFIRKFASLIIYDSCQRN